MPEPIRPSLDKGRLRRLERRARQYLDGGRLDAAQATLESLLQHAPHSSASAAVRMDLADVLLARGHMHAATRQLLEAAAAAPDDPMQIARLAQALHFHGETVAARHCFEQPQVHRTTSGNDLVALARARSLLDEPPATLDLLERALAAGIDTPDEHFSHALQLQFTGRIEQAAAELTSCLTRWPTFSGAAMTLMRLRRQTDAGHVDTFRKHVRHIPADNIVHAEFQFALFKLLSDLGRDDEAGEALMRGNAVMHALCPYDEHADTALADAVMRLPTAMPGMDHHGTADEGPIPIFVVGMPRSGTTLLERMLSRHPQVATAGELSDFPRQLRWLTATPGPGMNDFGAVIERSHDIDVHALGARYLAQTRWRAHGKRFYIDKLPDNHLLTGLIHQALPQAPILHMVRDPMDVCFSNFKAMFGARSEWSYAQPALARHYGLYRKLMQHWHEHCPGAVLDVDYADLVRNPDTAIARVLAHCGLPPEDDCVDPTGNPSPVSTPSSVQVREPLHTRALGAWQTQARHLAPLRRALEAGTH